MLPMLSEIAFLCYSKSQGDVPSDGFHADPCSANVA